MEEEVGGNEVDARKTHTRTTADTCCRRQVDEGVAHCVVAPVQPHRGTRQCVVPIHILACPACHASLAPNPSHYIIHSTHGIYQVSFEISQCVHLNLISKCPLNAVSAFFGLYKPLLYFTASLSDFLYIHSPVRRMQPSLLSSLQAQTGIKRNGPCELWSPARPILPRWFRKTSRSAVSYLPLCFRCTCELCIPRWQEGTPGF